MLDNHSARSKVAGGREAIETTGAKLLYLSPNSRDFNPIEQLFAKLTAMLRKAAELSISALTHAEILGCCNKVRIATHNGGCV